MTRDKLLALADKATECLNSGPLYPSEVLREIAKELRAAAEAPAQGAREREARALADRLAPLQYSVGVPFTYFEYRLVIDALRAYAAPHAEGSQTEVDIASEDDPEVIAVARAIAERGMGRTWDDFHPICACEIDHGDLMAYAQAAVTEMRSRHQSPAVKEIQSSDSGVESGHATASGSGPLPEPLANGDACSAIEPPRATNTVGRQQELKRAVGVTPDLSEAIDWTDDDYRRAKGCMLDILRNNRAWSISRDQGEKEFDEAFQHAVGILALTGRRSQPGNEIERLRAQMEQARTCLSNIDLSWLDTFDRGPDGDYGGVELGEEHKAFWRDAIAFLEASGGRPAPPPRMTESELMDALEASFPSLPSTEEKSV